MSTVETEDDDWNRAKVIKNDSSVVIERFDGCEPTIWVHVDNGECHRLTVDELVELVESQ